MSFDFTRTLSENEVRSTYINLTDDNGTTYGRLFPATLKRILVLDSQNRACMATRKPNQLWGNIARWFRENAANR